MNADPLLAAIRAVPMRCADCSAYSDQEQQLPCGLDPSSTHTWETDDAAIARAVRAWLREHEPNVAALIERWSACWYLAEGLSKSGLANAIRVLYRRAWGVS